MQQEELVQLDIPKDHPYYQLINQHAHKLSNIFQIKENDVLKQPIAPFPLKIYGRSTGNEFGAIFVYFYKMPIKAQEYFALVRDYSFQKKVDNNLDEFKPLKQLNIDNTELLFLSYKRVLIVMPRYFIYVRYTFRSNGDIWTITVSDPNSETIKQKTKGQIVFTATRIRQCLEGCQISVYSHIDMKMKLKFENALGTGAVQVNKYLKNIYNNIKEQK